MGHINKKHKKNESSAISSPSSTSSSSTFLNFLDKIRQSEQEIKELKERHEREIKRIQADLEKQPTNISQNYDHILQVENSRQSSQLKNLINLWNERNKRCNDLEEEKKKMLINISQQQEKTSQYKSHLEKLQEDVKIEQDKKDILTEKLKKNREKFEK